MPVCVLPADDELGVAVVRALRAQQAQIHAYCSGGGDVDAVRATGAFVAQGDLDDEGRIEATMAGVHTVVALHAVPTWPDAVRLDANLAVAIDAAAAAEVSRLILLSVPGAKVGAGDLLRDACGRAEAAAAAADLTSLVVTASLVETRRLVDALASMAPAVRAATTPVAPIAVDDLVAGLVGLDAARSQAPSGHARFVAQGRPTTLDRYVSGLGSEMVGRTYVPAGDVPLLAPSFAETWIDGADGAVDLWAFARISPAHPGE